MQDETIRSYPVHPLPTAPSDITVELSRSDSQTKSLYDNNTRQMLLDHMSTHLKISKASTDLLHELSNDLDKLKDGQVICIKLLEEIRNQWLRLAEQSSAHLPPPRPQNPDPEPERQRSLELDRASQHASARKLEPLDAAIEKSSTRSRSRSITKAVASCISKTTAVTPRRQSGVFGSPLITKK